jgi:ankyrin repeat protein
MPANKDALIQLVNAALEGKIDIVKELIEKLQKSKEGKKALSQALITAAGNSNLPVVKAFIEKLENSDDGKKALSQALITAVVLDNLPVVEALIANLKNSDNGKKALSQALMIAVRKGQTDIVQAFIANLKNSDDGKKALSQALMIAVRKGQTDIVQAFIANLKDSDDGKKALSQALIEAVKIDNNLPVVEALIAVKGIDFNAKHDNDTALMIAVRKGQTDIVQAFIANLKDSDDGKKALSQALIEAVKIDNNLPVVEALIAVKGIDFNAKHDNDTALMIAVRKGQTDIVQAFIANLKDSDDGKKALSQALIEAVKIDNNLPVVEALIANLKNSDDGKKALSQALIEAVRIDNNLPVVEALIAVKGIDFNAKHDNDTALMIAVRNGQTDIVQAFIANLKDSDDGKKALSQALIEAVKIDNNLPVVKTLLAVDVIDLNARDKFGHTALRVAVFLCKSDYMQAFIAKLQDSDDGKKALSQALITACALITSNKVLVTTAAPLDMEKLLKIVKALVAVDVIDLNARDEFGHKALYWAKDDEEITSLLKTKAKRINQENPDSSSAPSEGSTGDVEDTEPTDTLPPTTTASSAAPGGSNSGQAKSEQESSTASTNTSENEGSATSGTEVGRDTPKAKSIKQENLSSSAPSEGSTDEVGGTEPTDTLPPTTTASSAGPEEFNSGQPRPEQESSTASTNTSKSGGSAISGAGAHNTDNSDPTTFENVISDNTSDEELESSKKPGPYPNKQQLLTCLASTATCTAVAYGLFVQGVFPVMWDLYSVLAGGTVVGAIFALMLIRSVKVGGDDVARSTYDHPDTPKPGQQYQI